MGTFRFHIILMVYYPTLQYLFPNSLGENWEVDYKIPGHTSGFITFRMNDFLFFFCF